MISETPDYDPRAERAQTIDGAKARYVQQGGYTLEDYERDVERLLIDGEYPDKPPMLEGQVVLR